MKKNLKLFVDDERFPSEEGWDIARSFHHAIFLLETQEYDLVSLDHDIQSFYGNREMTGRDILNWLIERKQAGKHTPQKVVHHTQNSVGMGTMDEDIKRYWQ